MNKLVWNEKYSTGHKIIDIQHKNFVGLINNVISAQQNEYPKELVDQLLMGLWKYTEFHFESEEQIMVLNKYPGYESHKKVHKEIIGILGNKILIL